MTATERDRETDVPACDCRAATGFHQPSCATARPAVNDGDTIVTWIGCGCLMVSATGRMLTECASHTGRAAAERARVLAPIQAVADEWDTLDDARLGINRIAKATAARTLRAAIEEAGR